MSKVTTDEQDLLRTYPQRSRWNLGVERGVTLMSARVDGNHAIGATEILLKDVVFADGVDEEDLLRGMTVALHSAAINDRRVDACFLEYDNGTQILTIGPNGRQCDDDFYVTVFSAMKVWRVDEPAWDGSQHYPPFAIVGPARAGFTGEPLNFVGANSYSAIGRAVENPHWKFFFDKTIESGAVTDLGTVDAPVVVSWETAGEKLFRFRIDDEEGERGRTYRPVLIFDRSGENAPYSDVIVTNCKWTGSGWSADFVVYGVADRDVFPPEARVVLWAEDWYGDASTPLSAKQSIGGCLRGMGEILFDGWIRGEVTQVSADEQSVAFTAVSMGDKLKHVAMENFTLRDGDDTTDWHTFAGLNAQKAMLHLIQKHTTLTNVSDVFLATFDYQLGPLVDIPQGNLFAQLTQSVMPKFGYGACSRFGSVTFARDRNLLTEEMRAGLKGAAIVLTPDDWLELTPGKEFFGDLAQAVLEGKMGDDTPILAKYPPTGLAHAGDAQPDTGWIFKNQAQANELAELVYKRGNRALKHIGILLPNYRVVEPAFQEFFAVNLPSSQNNRGYNWTAKHFAVTDMELVFGNGYIMVRLGAETSRFSEDGESWTPDDSQPLENVYGFDCNLTADEGIGIN